jgi:hypothetical protein
VFAIFFFRKIRDSKLGNTHVEVHNFGLLCKLLHNNITILYMFLRRQTSKLKPALRGGELDGGSFKRDTGGTQEN